MAKTIRKGLIYEEDLAKNAGSGSATAARTTSTGGSQTLTKLGAGGAWYFGNINNILFVDGVKYTTIDAAITAAASAKTLIIIPSTYAGANASSNPSNVSLLDLRGKDPVGTIAGVHFGASTGTTAPRLFIYESSSSPTISRLAMWGVHSVTGAVPANEAQDGIAGDVHVNGALSSVGAGAIIAGVEASAVIASTGQTLPTVYGLTANCSTNASSTTNITDMVAIRAQAHAKSGSGTITNAYGLVLDAQSVGGTRNYSLWAQGNLLFNNDNSAIYALTAGGTARNIFWPNGNDIVEYKALDEASGKGIQFINIARTIVWLAMDSTQVSIPSLPLKLGSTVTQYNGISTVSNGVPAEYAQVNLTAQTAAVGTTTLYAVPASAGQYRLSWNAKITTAATTGAATSTLGALTIVYTDPDGVAITLTSAAAIAAGTIATTSTANTTGTVLIGVPQLLNCKASTNVTYAFAYASNTSNEMVYNLHIVLERL